MLKIVGVPLMVTRCYVWFHRQHQQHNAKISLLHPSNIDGIDMTQKRVEKIRFFKHVFLICRCYRPISAWAGTEFED
jgi:hypothetical protein